MGNTEKIREMVRSILKEDYTTPFSQMPDTEMLDNVGQDSIGFIGRDRNIYSWFESNRIQLIGGTQIWVKQNDYEVKRYIRKILGLFKG
jgi:tetrahydromethanopterin S-methyltransferase subunit F